MKKVILFGSILATLSSTTVVISCGENKIYHNKDDTKKQYLIGEAKKIDPKFKVEDDGFYIIGEDYNGTLLNNSTLVNKDVIEKGIVKIGETSGYGLTNSVQIGSGDSIYMIYDNDDLDGLSPENFNETLYLEDTSIMAKNEIKQANIKFGNKYISDGGGWGHTYIGFTKSQTSDKGILNKYIGGQNNHINKTSKTFDNSIKIFVNKYNKEYPEIVKCVLEYYGLKKIPNSSGVYENDPNLGGASKGFAPVFSTSAVFSYEKINDRAYKITFNGDEDYALTAGHFIIKQFDENLKKDVYKSYGSLSIGNENEWNSYFRNLDAKYVGTKKKIIKEGNGKN